MVAVKFVTDDKTWKLVYHDSVREAVEHAIGEGKPVPVGKRSSHERNEGGQGGFDREGWAGTPSFEDAQNKALKGWQDIRPNVDAVLTPVRERLAEVLDYAQEPGFDLTGFEPDIDRYLEGELECMREQVPNLVPAKGKVFTLLLNGCYNCNVSSDTVFRNGAAVAALVEAFQILGYDLNIFVECSVRTGGWGGKANGPLKNWTSLVRVHKAGEYLDINNVMFPLGNPSWLRRIVFGIMEQESLSVRKNFSFGIIDKDAFSFDEDEKIPAGQTWKPGGGYGSAQTLLTGDLVDASFTLSLGQALAAPTTQGALEWVLSQLEAQGVWERES